MRRKDTKSSIIHEDLKAAVAAAAAEKTQVEEAPKPEGCEIYLNVYDHILSGRAVRIHHSGVQIKTQERPAAVQMMRCLLDRGLTPPSVLF